MNNKELIFFMFLFWTLKTQTGEKYLRFKSSKTNILKEFKISQNLVSPDVKHAHNYIKINR
jgi:hypothetical protein